MKKKNILELEKTLENICGEANEAANLATTLFKDDELKVIRRELARIMEIIDAKILPIYRAKYPNFKPKSLE